MRRSITGVILDVDGTLVDSNAAHAHAWVDVLSEQGFDVDLAEVQRLIGMGTDKLLPTLVSVGKDSPLGRKLSERRKTIFRGRYLRSLQPTRGARALLDRLSTEQLGMMVASSADPDELASLLAICGAPELAHSTPPPHAVGGSKPDPDVVAAALGKLYRSSDEVLMLGDTAYDVEAARRAGIGTIALRSGGWQTEDFKKAGALAVYADPADLLEHYAESPLAALFPQNDLRGTWRD